MGDVNMHAVQSRPSCGELWRVVASCLNAWQSWPRSSCPQCWRNTMLKLYSNLTHTHTLFCGGRRSFLPSAAPPNSLENAPSETTGALGDGRPACAAARSSTPARFPQSSPQSGPPGQPTLILKTWKVYLPAWYLQARPPLPLHHQTYHRPPGPRKKGSPF